MSRCFLTVILFSALLFGAGVSQESVFLLVDVSGNPLAHPNKISEKMRQEALHLAKNMMMNCFRPAEFPDWVLSGITDNQIQAIVDGRGKPLIGTGGFLMLMPFGDRNAYQDFKINPIENYPEDIERFFQFHFSYVQQQTYSEIAKAKAADVAAEAKIDSYFLIVIIGLGEDTNSERYTPEELNYLDAYRSSVQVNSLAIFRYAVDAVDYKVEISRIDISKMRTISPSDDTKGKMIRQKNVDRKVLEIISPPGSKDEPYFTETTDLLVSWRCIGCDENAFYKIIVTDLKAGHTVSHPTTHQMQQNISLQPGEYKIVVFGENLRSKPRYVSISASGGCGNIFWLLILFAVFLVSYLIKKQIRKDQKKYQLEHDFGDASLPAEPGNHGENKANKPDKPERGSYQTF